MIAASLAAAANALSLQRKARSGELAAQSILSLQQDPARSVRLALLALAQNPDNQRGEYALRQAMAALEVAQADQIVDLLEPIGEARYTPGFEYLVVSAGNTVWLRKASDLSEVAKLSAPGKVSKAWLVGRQPGNPLLVGTAQGKVYLLAPDGKLRADLSCTGQDNPWTSLAYSAGPAGAAGQPDRASQLAVGCSAGELTRWDLASSGAPVSHPLLRASAQARSMHALGFSADGQYLALGDTQGDALVWQRGLDARPWIGDPKAGKHPLHHQAAIRDISFSPTEPSLLATASDDGSAVIWTLDLKRGLLNPSPDARRALQHDRPVAIARFVDRSDEQNRLMTVSDKRVFFWSDVDLRDERRHDDEVIEASVSKDGEQLVSASLDGTARVWSSRSTMPVAVLRGHNNTVVHALFGPPGRVITASLNGTLRGWRLNAPTLLKAGTPWLTAQALLPGGLAVLACSESTARDSPCDALAWAAGGANSQPVSAPSERPAGGQAQAAPGQTAQAPIAQAQAAPAQAKRAPAGAAKDRVSTPVTHWGVAEASLSADGQWLLFHDRGYDLAQAYKPVLIARSSGQDSTPDWLANSRQAVFGHTRAELAVLRGARIEVWPQAALAGSADAPAGQALLRLPAQADVSAVALSPDGRWLATLGEHIQLWNREDTQAKPITLTEHRGALRSVIFSPDSRSLVSASADRSVRVWTLPGLVAGQTLDCPDRLARRIPHCVVLSGGHSAALQSAHFSPDGQRVVTASADNSIRVWDAATGHEWAALYRHGGKVNSALFDLSDAQIVSVSDDGTAQVGRCDACRLPLQELKQRAQTGLRLTESDEAALKADALSWLPRWLGGR